MAQAFPAAASASIGRTHETAALRQHLFNAGANAHFMRT
jgi:hypothetical protein